MKNNVYLTLPILLWFSHLFSFLTVNSNLAQYDSSISYKSRYILKGILTAFYFDIEYFNLNEKKRATIFFSFL